MYAISIGLALVSALVIVALGGVYIVSPRRATHTFGLPLPDEGANTTWWLRLKGVRDLAAGVALLACLAWTAPRVVGIVLLADAIIPIGDMLVVLAAKGSARRAYGLHGFSALVMILTATALIMGGAR